MKDYLIKGDLCVVVVVWLYFIADPLSTQTMKTPQNFIRGITLACVHHLHKCRGRNPIFKKDLGHGDLGDWTKLAKQISQVGI